MSLTRRQLLERTALGAGVVAFGDLGTLLAASPASATSGLRRQVAGTRTAAELFGSLRPGSSVDLHGEMIEGTDVDSVPAGVTVQNGTFLGQMQLYDADRVTLEGCTFIGDPTTELKTICKFLGGDGWQVLDSTFRGGVVASQLGMGLNTRAKGRQTVPTNWLVDSCTFLPLDGQWGEYPQGHAIYCLTSPRVRMNARIEHCSFSGSPFGAPLKLGGTGNDPHREGVKGVVVTDCVIGGVPDDAGRCLAVLTQGQRTNVALSGCTLTAPEGAIPWVQAMDGALVSLENTELPQGVVEYATWWRGGFIFQTEKKITVAPGEQPPDIPHHIEWS